jgi:anaerobic selenocysteine-containing dehydrogenase
VLAASKPFDPFTSGTGLATPSGKVELYSSVLAGLGYDPLPYYKEPAQTPISNPDLAKEYPLTLFAGLREGPFYNTNLRHVDSLRRALPDPLTLLNPQDGLKFGLADGDWVWVETTHGRVKMKTSLDSVQPAGTIRVPHGWWMAELEPGLESGLSGAMVYNDGMILSDDDWNLDREQGLPNLRGGILAKAYKV